MALLSFTVEGDDVLVRNLRIVADGIGDMRKEFAKIGQLVKGSALENLESGGSEGGGRWKPLRPSTVKARKNRTGYYKRSPQGASPQGPVLQWTGNMRRGFRYENEKDLVVIDNPVQYFKHHQAKDRKSPNLPRRLVLELKQADKVAALNIIAAGINQRLGNFGRQY